MSKLIPDNWICIHKWAAGEFWDEESHYLGQALIKLYGAEGERIIREEVKEQKSETDRAHPFHIFCNPAFLPHIKAASACES